MQSLNGPDTVNKLIGYNAYISVRYNLDIQLIESERKNMEKMFQRKLNEFVVHVGM